MMPTELWSYMETVTESYSWVSDGNALGIQGLDPSILYLYVLVAGPNMQIVVFFRRTISKAKFQQIIIC